MSFNKENEMINIKFLDDKENSLICSQSKTSRKNSFSMNNGKFFKDKSDSKENRLSELENDKSKKNIQIYNCKLNEILFQYNNNTEKDYFDTNFFMCMKYIYYKNNFKKKYKMGIAENCYYLINKNWIYKWKAFTNYKIFKKFFSKIKIQDNMNLVSLEHENFLEEEDLIKFKKEFYDYVKINDLNLSSKSYPGPVDNISLLKKLDEDDTEDYSLNPENYSLIKEYNEYSDGISTFDENMWLLFTSKFSGGPLIRRKIVNFSDENQRLEVEMQHLELNIIVLKNRENLHSSRENIFYFKCAMSKNDLLSDLKELVRKKLLTSIQKEFLNKFFDNEKFCKEISFFNSEKFTINILNPENANLNYPFVEKFNGILVKKLEKEDPKDLSINSNYYENITYDIQNNLLNLEIEDQSFFIVELTDEKNNSIINSNKDIRSNYTEEDCSICFRRKILFYNCKCQKVYYCSKRCYNRGFKIHIENCLYSKFEENNLSRTNESQNGICGLSNLGNTCYMNTALQCLSNCKELTLYFIEGYFLNYVNTTSSLSSKGKLASEFCYLLKNLWFGNQSYFSPISFKSLVERLNHNFMGFEQHDTHEFLNFFLDKLNDDLNRVTEKPSNILSNKEENEPDIILKSDIYWKYFEMRNQSIVTDLFYGQFMSTIKCPICNTCSINFDPFLTLNFPIPKLNQEPEFNFECYFIFFNLKNYPLKINITINRTIRIFQLRKFLAKILKLNPLSFYMYYIGNGIIAKILSCSDIINCENAKKKIFMMQIDPRIFDNNSNRKYYDLLSITKQIKNGNFINIKTKLEYFTMNLLLQEKNDKFLECSNKNSNNFDDNNKEFEYLVKNIYDQPNNSNQILKEILKEYEETVDEELNHCPTSKTIGKYSNPFNPEFETSIDYLFEILIERIFKEEFNLFLLLKDKLKEFIIKDKKSIIKKNDQQKSIIFHDIENNNDSSVSTEEKYFVEKKIIKDLVNKIKDIDINEKINALNYFNFLLEREQEFEKLAYASDENNYLEDNFLKSIMDFCSIEEEKYNSYDRKSFSSNKSNAFSSKKKNFISPAVILTIDKQWNLEYLNEYIYNFLKNLVEKDRKYENLAKKFLLFDYNCYKTLNNKKELFATNQIPFIILIKPVFITKKVKVIKNANSQINLDNNHQEKNSEFTVQSTLKEGFKPILHSIYYDEEKDNFQNAGQNSNNGELQDKIETSNNEKIEDILEEKEIQICLFCEKEDCDGCILHAENSIRVSDLLLKYKDHNINLELKNEFLYLDDYLQNSTNNKLKKSLDFRLELVIQSEFIDCINSIRSVDSKNLKFHAILVKEHNLINSFENFKRVEKLEKTDEWKCPKCNDFRQANKKLEIYKAPKILIIHLNRFSYFDNRKINTEINFPIESLILDKYVVKKERSRKSIINDEDNKEFKFENVYDLFAIANHYGSLDGGHYIAVAKNPENSEWFQFNDSNVSRIKEINKSSAYLLFYRKRSFDDS